MARKTPKNIKWQVHEAIQIPSSLNPLARLLMFVFADLADAETGVIPEKRAPSIDDLRLRTSMSKSSVIRQKADLIALGWLTYKKPTWAQMSLHQEGTYTIKVGRHPEAEPVSPTDTPVKAPKKPRKARPVSQEDTPGATGPDPSPDNDDQGPVSQGDTPAQCPSDTPPVSPTDTPESDPLSLRDTAGVSQGHTAVCLRDTPIEETNPDLSNRVAADAAHTPSVGALFDAPERTPSSETDNQRANRLAAVYTDRVKLSKFVAVAGIVRSAIKADYTDQQITDGLNRLADENRVVTIDGLRVAMDGPPRKTNGHVPYRNPTDPAAYSGGIR